MLKIYKHEGEGLYIGSCIVVVSDCKENAEKQIREILDKNGLTDEEIDELDEFKIKKDSIIVEINGDY